MINEERVILMTKMAAYEQHEQKRNVAIGSFFRSDYIGYQVLKSIICTTIAFFILFGLFVFYDFEVFMQDIYKMDVLAFGKSVLMYYVGFVVVSTIISYIVYSYRYRKARKNLRNYYGNLKKLQGMYERQA